MERARWKRCRVFFVEETIHCIKVKDRRQDNRGWFILLAWSSDIFSKAVEGVCSPPGVVMKMEAPEWGSPRGFAWGLRRHCRSYKPTQDSRQISILSKRGTDHGRLCRFLQKSIYSPSTAALRRTVEMDLKCFFSSRMKNKANLDALKSWTTIDWDFEIWVLMLWAKQNVLSWAWDFKSAHDKKKKQSPIPDFSLARPHRETKQTISCHTDVDSLKCRRKKKLLVWTHVDTHKAPGLDSKPEDFYLLLALCCRI